MSVEPEIVAETERLLIRNWIEPDRDFFHEICSDPHVMEFFPGSLSRLQSDAFLDRMQESIRQTGIGFAAVTRKSDGHLVGFCGLKKLGLGAPFTEETIEIGWRLASRYWANGYATEAATALLQTGFEKYLFDEILAITVPNNLRSIAVMQRIGLKRDTSRDFDNPRVPDSYSRLKKHLVYALSRREWSTR